MHQLNLGDYNLGSGSRPKPILSVMLNKDLVAFLHWKPLCTSINSNAFFVVINFPEKNTAPLQNCRQVWTVLNSKLVVFYCLLLLSLQKRNSAKESLVHFFFHVLYIFVQQLYYPLYGYLMDFFKIWTFCVINRKYCMKMQLLVTITKGAWGQKKHR